MWWLARCNTTTQQACPNDNRIKVGKMMIEKGDILRQMFPCLFKRLDRIRKNKGW